MRNYSTLFKSAFSPILIAVTLLMISITSYSQEVEITRETFGTQDWDTNSSGSNPAPDRAASGDQKSYDGFQYFWKDTDVTSFTNRNGDFKLGRSIRINNYVDDGATPGYPGASDGMHLQIQPPSGTNANNNSWDTVVFSGIHIKNYEDFRLEFGYVKRARGGTDANFTNIVIEAMVDNGSWVKLDTSSLTGALANSTWAHASVDLPELTGDQLALRFTVVKNNQMGLDDIVVYGTPVFGDAVIFNESFGTQDWDTNSSGSNPAPDRAASGDQKSYDGFQYFWKDTDVTTFTSTNGRFNLGRSIRINNYVDDGATPGYPGASDGMHLQVQPPSGTNANNNSWDTVVVSDLLISGFQGFSLDFGYVKRNRGGTDANFTNIVIEAKFDDGEWIKLDTSSISGALANSTWAHASIALPDLTGDYLALRFTVVKNNQMGLDDVILKGSNPGGFTGPKKVVELTRETFGTQDWDTNSSGSNPAPDRAASGEQKSYDGFQYFWKDTDVNTFTAKNGVFKLGRSIRINNYVDDGATPGYEDASDGMHLQVQPATGTNANSNSWDTVVFSQIYVKNYEDFKLDFGYVKRNRGGTEVNATNIVVEAKFDDGNWFKLDTTALAGSLAVSTWAHATIEFPDITGDQLSLRFTVVKNNQMGIDDIALTGSPVYGDAVVFSEDFGTQDWDTNSSGSNPAPDRAASGEQKSYDGFQYFWKDTDVNTLSHKNGMFKLGRSIRINNYVDDGATPGYDGASDGMHLQVQPPSGTNANNNSWDTVMVSNILVAGFEELNIDFGYVKRNRGGTDANFTNLVFEVRYDEGTWVKVDTSSITGALANSTWAHASIPLPEVTGDFMDLRISVVKNNQMGLDDIIISGSNPQPPAGGAEEVIITRETFGTLDWDTNSSGTNPAPDRAASGEQKSYDGFQYFWKDTDVNTFTNQNGRFATGRSIRINTYVDDSATPGYEDASEGMHVQVQPSTGTNANSNSWDSLTFSNIYIKNYENLRLSFGYVKRARGGTDVNFTNLLIEASVDGGAWTKLDTSSITGSLAVSTWAYAEIAMPDVSGDVLSLRFTVVKNNQMGLDDITVYGTPVISSSEKSLFVETFGTQDWDTNSSGSNPAPDRAATGEQTSYDGFQYYWKDTDVNTFTHINGAFKLGRSIRINNYVDDGATPGYSGASDGMHLQIQPPSGTNANSNSWDTVVVSNILIAGYKDLGLEFGYVKRNRGGTDANFTNLVIEASVDGGDWIKLDTSSLTGALANSTWAHASIPMADIVGNYLSLRLTVVKNNQMGIDDLTVRGVPDVVIQNLLVSAIEVTGMDGALTIEEDGGTLQMVANITPVGAAKAVTWEVENKSGVASISESGLLTAEKNGVVTVIAHATDTSGVSGMVDITISNQIVLATSIRITSANGASAIVLKGGTLQLVAQVLPADATNKVVVWSSVNGTGEATINETTGLLTAAATANGEVTVTATTTDGSEVSASIVITLLNQALGFKNLNDVTVYPNPTQGLIQVSDDSKIDHFEVFDLGGKMLMQADMDGNFIDLTGLEKGLYLIQFYKQSELQGAYRIVKE